MTLTRASWTFSRATALALLAITSVQGQTTLIDFDLGADSLGNGALFSDPDGVAAPAATPLGFEFNNPETPVEIDSINGIGRAFIFNGETPTALPNFAGILGTDDPENAESPGVAISGWSAYRIEYFGGSDAIGFLEDTESRLNVGVEAFNGLAFSNSSDFALISDPIDLTGAANDSFDLSVLAGSDSIDQLGVVGPNSFDLTAFLILDDTTVVEIGSSTVTGLPTDADDRQDFTGFATAGFSTVRAAFQVDAESAGGNAIRSLLDNIQFIVTEGEPVTGDFNGDGIVDGADYATFRDNLGAADDTPIQDLGDGVPGVDGGDFTVFLDNFGAPFAGSPAVAPSAIPEPSSTLLIVMSISALGLAGRRR